MEKIIRMNLESTVKIYPIFIFLFFIVIYVLTQLIIYVYAYFYSINILFIAILVIVNKYQKDHHSKRVILENYASGTLISFIFSLVFTIYLSYFEGEIYELVMYNLNFVHFMILNQSLLFRLTSSLINSLRNKKNNENERVESQLKYSLMIYLKFLLFSFLIFLLEISLLANLNLAITIFLNNIIISFFVFLLNFKYNSLRS